MGQIADPPGGPGRGVELLFFQLRTRLAGRSDELKPGHYTLRTDMSFTAALDQLEQGLPPDVVQVSIPEGLSRAEMRRE